MEQRATGSSAPPKRRYTPRNSGLSTMTKRSKSEGRLTVRRVKGSTGISGRCRSDGSMIVKGNWTDAEDEQLVELVHQFLDIKRDPKGIASTRWSEIAKALPGRVGKQCRERWHNHLRPDINKGRWTIQEEVTIYLCWRSWNSQWARISRILDGRSDNRVKNHWNCHMKRRLNRDPPYFEFMENCHKTLGPTVNFNYDDDFEDNSFRDNLLPKVEEYLTEHKSQLDRLPYFSTTRRDSATKAPDTITMLSDRQTTFPSMLTLLQTPVRQAKRSAKQPKMKKVKRRRCDSPSSSSGEESPMTSQQHAWRAASTDRQRDVNAENNYLSSRVMDSPRGGYGPYGSMSQETYAVEVKEELDHINGGGLTTSPSGGHYTYSHSYDFRSPIPVCGAEVVVEEDGMQQPNLYGDPLWSRAVSADFSVGSPMYYARTGGVTSTPLKASSSFNVPSASECGAGLLSPYLGLRQFPGFHSAEDDALLSPIRRSFCDASSIDETVWSPSKVLGRWTPVKLGSLTNMVKTPQAIREALASSEVNRSRISPEDLASPSRLFSDASELIDGEMNRSGHGMSKTCFSTPESIVKCRRRLTDQWTVAPPLFGTPSFHSSGYESFQTGPSGQL